METEIKKKVSYQKMVVLKMWFTVASGQSKAAGNSSMDFCLFLTQYATDDGRRQLCTVLALMNFPYDGFFFFVNFLAAMG